LFEAAVRGLHPIGFGFLDGRLAFDGMSITVEVHDSTQGWSRSPEVMNQITPQASGREKKE